MKTPIRSLLKTAMQVLTLALFSLAASVCAQDKYPSRPVSIIVSFGPGSSSDASVRLLTSKIQPHFGQPLLVENRAGANATLGPAYVTKARPDGYTLLYGSTSSMGTAPGLIKGLPYDPIRDFAGITVVGEQYIALLTRAEFKGLGFPQFLERMRQSPDSFAIGGQSAYFQILNKMMTDTGKLKHLYVPYAEAGRMMNDLWGGRIGGLLISAAQALPMQRSGQGYVVAISSMDRLPGVPGIPTMHETLAGVHTTSWTGYFAPAKTPRPIISSLSAMFTEANRDPDILKRNEDGGRALFLTPDETDAYVRKDVLRWSALLKSAGIEPE